MLFETKLTQVFAELQTQENVPDHTISNFWKYLNAKIIPQPFTTGGSFTVAILVLEIFDSAIALALQSTNNNSYLSLPAQDARNSVCYLY